MPYAPEIEALFDLLAESFPDNTDYLITPAMARTGVGGILDYLGNLTTNQVKGGLFRVPYVVNAGGQPTVPTALIPTRSRVLGMDVQATNGTDEGSVLAGVKADPITFKLLAYSTGTIDALVDEKPGTTATVKARWVRTSGTDEEKIASYLDLPLEDYNVYRGEVYQYTFEQFTPPVTRLLEIRQDLTMFSHPVPTGLDSDPYYKSFAPLTGSSAYDDTAIRKSIADSINARLTATATVLFANGSASREFSTHDSAQGVAAPGDLIILRGFHPEIIVKKSIDVNAEGAVIAGLVANYLQSGFTYTWRGGYFTNRIFTGRTTGVPHNITFERVKLGPNAYHQSHTNNTNTSAAADRYTFRDSHLTHVAVNQRNDSNQYQSVFYERCSFVPTTDGAIFRGQFNAQSIVTALQCRFQPLAGGALFDSPSLGRFSLSGVSTVGMTAGGVNLLSDGLRVVDVANPFNPPATAQPLYPAGGIDYTTEVAVSVDTTGLVNKAYVLQGAGCTFTLPAGAAIGATLVVRVDETAEGMFPIVGISGLNLWAGESASFRQTAQGYRIASKTLRAMSAEIQTANAQQDSFTSNVFTTVPFSQQNNRVGPPALVNLSTHGFVVQRRGLVNVSATVRLVNCESEGFYYLAFQRAGVTLKYGLGPVAKSGADGFSGFQSVINLSENIAVEAGDVLIAPLYPQGVTAQPALYGVADYGVALFRFTELT